MAIPVPLVRMKLYIDTQSKRVLFAETNSTDIETVHLLFRQLSLPMPTLLTQQQHLHIQGGRVGSLVNHWECRTRLLNNGGGGGGVTTTTTYIVMDNLVVEPYNPICISSCISLFHQLKVKDFGSLVQKEVCLPMDEALITLFKASLQSHSQNVLTHVFLLGEKPVLLLEERKEANHDNMDTFGSLLFMQNKHLIPEIVCSMFMEGKIEFSPEVREELLARIRSSSETESHKAAAGVSEWVVVDH